MAVRKASLAVALAFLAGCDTNAGPEQSALTVSDSAGVEIVQNGPERGPPLELVETLRLGVLEGDGPEQFSEIYAVALGRDGTLVVGNNGSVTARVFDADGTFVSEVGGRGQGPAETTSVNDVLALGDTVVVIDWQRGGKAVAFTFAGEFVGDWGFVQPNGSRVMPVHRDSLGWLARVFPPFRPPSLAPGEAWPQVVEIGRMQWGDAEVGESLFEVPQTVLYGVDGAESGVDWALLPATWHTGFDSEGRLFVTDPTTYRIDIRDASGLLRSVRRDYEPRPFTDADAQQIIEASVHAIDTMSQIPEQYRPESIESTRRRLESQARLPRPETIPPLGGLLVSPDGSFWIERWDVQPPEYAGMQRTFGFGTRVPSRETIWELFDQDGVFRGRVTLPARFRAEAVRDRTVVGVWLDEFDVEYVVRYRVDGL